MNHNSIKSKTDNPESELISFDDVKNITRFLSKIEKYE
jgi:hypothetical protein